jgi:hypothetical protein
MLAAMDVMGETVVATRIVPGALPVDSPDEQAASAVIARDAAATAVRARFMGAA